MIWRVGDGSRIRVWTDPWLPRTWARRPLTPRGNNLISRVDELVDPTTGSWDVQLVKDTFLEVDAKLILSLPIHTIYLIQSHGILMQRVCSQSVRLIKLNGKLTKERRRGRQSTSQSRTRAEGMWKRSGDYIAQEKLNISCGGLHITHWR
jgi:hypothetical protein